MPFKSEAQRKLCYLLKNKGQAGSWDCSEWSAETGKKKLPEHVKKQEEKKALEAVAKLARCWAGYEPVPGKEPFSNDSCRPKTKSKKQEEKKGSNILVGGKGDNKKPSDFPKDVIDEAVKHEMEHTSNKDVAQEIAVDHLTEDVDYYKKLKKIEGNKEAAMHKLAKAWSANAKISKLAEVATVPNRGAGDKQETVIDTDPTEGLPKVNEVESSSLPDKQPVNKRLRSAQARKALISATRKTFGTNPTGGSLFSKTSADKLGEAPAASQPQSQSGIKPPKISPGAIMSGAGSAIGNAFKGVVNDEAYKALQQQANSPDMIKAYESAKGMYNQIGNTVSNKYQNFIKNIEGKVIPNAVRTANKIFPNTNLGYLTYLPDESITPAIKAYMNTRNNSNAGANTNYNSPYSLSSMYSKLPQGFRRQVEGVTGGIRSGISNVAQGATDAVTRQEAARRTAGYALPVVDFFRNNPWAAYALTAGGGLLGGALLGRMFGGDEESKQQQGNPVESAMAQGYAQQAARQMPANAYDPRSRYA